MTGFMTVILLSEYWLEVSGREIIFRKEDKAFFVYGFAKNDQDNISKDELRAFKSAAKELLALSDEQIKLLVVNKALIEVKL